MKTKKNNESLVSRARGGIVGLLVAQSIVWVLFGIAALFWPGITLALFISLFGITVLIAGVIAIIYGLSTVRYVRTWPIDVIIGVLLVVVGVFLVRNIEVSIATLILLVAAVLVIRGIFDIVGGFFGKDWFDRWGYAEAKWFYIIGGIISVIAGIVVLNYPAESGLAFVWVLGLYAVLRGAFDFGLALQIRSDDDK